MKKPLSKATAQRIDRAMAIIGETADRKMVERAVKSASEYVGRAKNAKQSGRYGTLTEAHKKAARRLARRLEGVLRDRRLADDLRLEAHALWWKAEAVAVKKLSPSSRPMKADHIEAAKAAYHLLKRHGLPVTVSRRKGRDRFCRLAALLWGDEHANLYNACRMVKGADQNGV
jgi:hypothetical protein